MTESPELLVVVPVYNEESAIDRVIREWFAVLEENVGAFVMLVINDGSSDNTQEILSGLQLELSAKLEVLTRANRGHGQTCLEGYRNAIERGIPYVLQIDSDGQSRPNHLSAVWQARLPDGVVYGKRLRSDGIRRIAASLLLRILLRIFIGVDCIDANVPYRLMATKTCAPAIRRIPPTVNLANVALAVLLQRDKSVTHAFVPISFPPRLGGEPSVPFHKFAFRAFELFSQLRKLDCKPPP